MNEKVVLVKGDCHGDETDLVYIAEDCRDLGVRMCDLVIVVAGDFGIPWPGNSELTKRQLGAINRIGCDVVAVLGNHDWWSLVRSMPQGMFCGANVRQCFFDGVWYENIHYVVDPTVMTVDGKDYLLIPGADSHDIRDGVLRGLRPIGETESYSDWWDENCGDVREFEDSFKNDNRYWPQYRIDGVTWWDDETPRIDLLYDLLDKRGKSYHAVVSHDAPDRFAYEFQLDKSLFDRYPPTDAERALDEVYKKLSFRHWVHGHFHRDAVSREDGRVRISYFVPVVLSDNLDLTADTRSGMIYMKSEQEHL